jgi:hypothetical protein
MLKELNFIDGSNKKKISSALKRQKTRKKFFA